MINSYLYCNGLARGYRQIVADSEKKELRYPETNEILPIISLIWTHSGTNAIGGFENGQYYFVIKEMKSVQRSNDDQGRPVCMNLAFSADEASKEEFLCFVKGFLICYNAACAGFAECFNFINNIAGYEIDFNKWQKVIELCVKNTGNEKKLSEIAFRGKNRIQFLFLQYDLNDFRTQTGLNDIPDSVYDSNVYNGIISDSLNEFSENEISSAELKKTPCVEKKEIKTRSEKEEKTSTDSIDPEDILKNESNVINIYKQQVEEYNKQINELRKQNDKFNMIIESLTKSNSNAKRVKIILGLLLSTSVIANIVLLVITLLN